MTDNADPSGQSGNFQPDQTGEASNAGNQSADRTYTQADIDRVVSERLARERNKYADYDEMKKRLADMEAAGQTELEKVTKVAAEADAARAKAVAERNELLVTTLLTRAALAAGATDADVVVALLRSQFSVDEAGELAGDPVKAINELLESKPYLRAGSNGTTTRGSADGGAHGRTAPATKPSQGMDNLLRSERGAS
jgi:hypothetical protein